MFNQVHRKTTQKITLPAYATARWRIASDATNMTKTMPPGGREVQQNGSADVVPVWTATIARVRL